MRSQKNDSPTEKLRILVCTGRGWYSSSFVDMFERNGCVVRLLEYTSDNVLKLERKNPLSRIRPWLALRKANRRVLDETENFRPDLVFVVNGEQLFRETVQKIAARTKIAHWAVDGVRNLRTHPSNLRDYPLSYVFEPTDAQLIPNARFLSLGADERFYFPRKEPKLFDVSFVGSPHPDRMEFLERVARASAGKFGFALFGPFSKISRERFPATCACVRKSARLNHEEIADIYRKSKIVLNPHHSQSKIGVNPRVFEVAACGTFQLCSNQAALPQFFPRGEITVYDDDEIEKIEYFLAHDDERERRAAEACSVALRKNTFAARARDVLRDAFPQDIPGGNAAAAAQ